ncbi:MAG TPA: SOS response-associated peptidase [Methanoculleus sp.]|nr:SOS response-associated peptidase [Methanoculleus sp.]
MCGRYSLIVTDDLGARFRVHDPLIGLRSQFNVTPGREMPVVRDGAEVRMECMVWGLVPSWAKDPSVGRRLINARAETVAEKPAFRASFATRRCLVPASGFYEWRREKGEAIPFYYRLERGGHFAFAGLFDTWHDPAGGERRGYVILTTDANALVGRVHDRMPVILHREDEEAWMDGKSSAGLLERFFAPFPPEEMTGWRVSTKVNSPDNDSPDLIEPQETARRWW